MKSLVLPLLVFFQFSYSQANAICAIHSAGNQMAPKQGDAFFTLMALQQHCPESSQSLEQLIMSSNLKTKPYLVGNRGYHNPAFGSFSFFETVSGTLEIKSLDIQDGEFFFGHFTAEQNGEVVLDQLPEKGKLLIELIAWDYEKQFFNFYELIGNGKGGDWFYRGDSEDILKDGFEIYLKDQAHFGNRLRCSGCHSSGGPIMKELAPPHNDWWTVVRPLPFEPNSPSNELSKWMQNLGDASDLSSSVETGVSKLQASPTYQAAKQKLNLQTQLKPLFCESEVNLESDTEPLESPNVTVTIPSASVVNPLLATAQLGIPKAKYLKLLQVNKMNFPETNERDADHPWLTPVKAKSELMAIQQLIQSGTITEEFAFDVLAVDMTNPLFSKTRCDLLKLVPPTGLQNFTMALSASTQPGARELFDNLTNPEKTESAHKISAQKLLSQTAVSLQNESGQAQAFNLLVNARQSVFDSIISKNPRGQIFEPGFRVIFPIRAH